MTEVAMRIRDLEAEFDMPASFANKWRHGAAGKGPAQIGGDQIGLDDPLDEPESLREGDAD